MQRASGPAALKRAVRTARNLADIGSDEDLAERAGVSANTLANWWSGKHRPRGRELVKVTQTIGVPLSTLEAIYEGRSVEPAGIEALVTALTEQTAALNALVGRIDDLFGPMSEALAGVVAQQAREATRRRRSGAASS